VRTTNKCCSCDVAVSKPKTDVQLDSLSAPQTPLSHSYDISAPTLFLDGHGQHTITSAKNYLALSLDLKRLHLIHKRLWLAGLPVPARALHRQKVLGREIVISDQAELHLTWRESTLYLKPLPKPLLDYNFWESKLCSDDTGDDLYKNAAGLILSYIWLISSKQDLAIAHEKNLVPKGLKWKIWAKFSRDFLKYNNLIGLDTQVAKRYEYGELRVTRLNKIYRFAPEMRFKNVVRGYFYGYNRYSDFLGRNFAWAAVAVLYIGLILTAMQVALGVDQIKDSKQIQNSAYGFSVLSMVGVTAVSAVALAYVVLVAIINLFYTTRKRKARAKERETEKAKSA
jgi:hypothetical protein